MKKDFIICICAIVIGACGWVGFQQYDKYQVAKFAAEQKAAAVAAEMEQTVEKQKALELAQQKRRAEEKVMAAKKVQTLAADRQAVETELGACRLSSIMLGSPSIAIINKKGYEPGNEISLPSGKVLSVASIQDEAVMLSDGQQSYRLVLPAAREISAKR